MEHSPSFPQIPEIAGVSHGFVGADLDGLSNEAATVCLRRFIMSDKSTDVGCASDLLVDSSSYPNNDVTFDKDLDSESLGNINSTDSNGSGVFPISGDAVFSCNNQKVAATDECFSVTQGHQWKISFEDFERARMKIRLSVMREVPKVKWKDIGGQEEVKAQLMEVLAWPQKHQDAFNRIGTRPPPGVLMFGPPGCSKTLMARAVAREAWLNFLAVKCPELFSKWVGESEKAVRSLFAEARSNAPSIIFFDEIDSLAIIRGRESDGLSVSDRVMIQLLVELDGLQERVNVTVIAATNRPDKIDPALLIPGGSIDCCMLDPQVKKTESMSSTFI